jgi:hypothetical protein
MKRPWPKAVGLGLIISTVFLQTSCAGLAVGGAFLGGGVAGYYVRKEGLIKWEKKEGEERTKEGKEEKKTKREIGCLLPF